MHSIRTSLPLVICTLTLSLLLLAGCAMNEAGPGNNQENDTPPQDTEYQAVDAFPNLADFERPVDFQHPGDGTSRVFVVEQRGVISVFENDPQTEMRTVFLNIEDRVDDARNEEGLLGLAFHPDYETNGLFYVNYTAANPDRTVISEFSVDPDNPSEALMESENVILTFLQPNWNHNGGQISFGPDGYLYIAVGDGGGSGDPQGNGQNRSTLLGSILRIDVINTEGGLNYAIPDDNPFAGNTEGFREEIYAYGLRNPWRFSFDDETGELWAGDVGQNAFEEISVIENGGNYGWNIMEANHCFQPRNNCDMSGLEEPLLELPQSGGDRSVTGGFVYRGPALENLNGHYIFADYVSRRIYTLDASDRSSPDNRQLLQPQFNISSFGVDSENELYICAFDGRIYKLDPA